ncbi:MAG: YceI family protein [Geminicoccales bacterium]
MADQFEHRYGGIAQLLHWLIAIMIFVMFALGWYMTDLETGAEKFALYQIHKGIGVTILAVAVLRLLWRLTHPAPPLPVTMKGWERLAASGTHWVLYALIFLQPLIGILQSNAANFPIVLWGSIQLPALIGQDQAMEERLVGLHHLFAKAMALLILAHIGAAFRHHFMLKDDILKRMLPNGAIAVGVVVLAIGLIGPFFVTPDEEPATAKVEVTGVVNTDSSGDTTVSSEVANVAETAEADQPAASDPVEQVAAAEEDLPADAWIVDNGSVLGFLAFQQGSDVQGSFENFAAEIVFNVDDLVNSRLFVDIDVTSITTGHGDRDKTLNSPSFFDTVTWPRATFESKTITANGDGGFDVVADLTMRDVTKEVTLSFTLEIAEDPNDPTRELAEAKGELPIHRLDYGIGQGDWTSTTTVADEVVISIDIKASRAK